MEDIQKWAIAVCAAAVICTLLRQLFPDNRLGEQGRMLLPCLFLCVLISPIPSLFQDVKMINFTAENTVDAADLTLRMQDQVKTQVNNTLLQMVNQSLSTYGWAAKKVEANMDIGEDGSIEMGQIVVYVDETVGRRATAVKQIAEQRLGTTVTVAVWEETG